MSAPPEHPGTDPRPHDDPDGAPARQGDARRPGRGLTVFAGVAAGGLALIHALDLIQVLIGLPLTAYDVGLMVYPRGLDGLGVAAEAPLNLAQTAILAVVTVAALLGGLLCLGRRGGAARAGGVLAVLAVVVPTVLPLGLHPLSTVVRGDGFPAEWLWNLLYVGYPALVSASAALPGLLAAILLIAARPRRSRPLGAAGSIVGILLAGAFTVEAAVALVRQLSGEAGWWALGWYGVAAMDPYSALALSLGLLVMIVLMGIGTGMLLGSASLLTRLGGWLLVVALVLRVLSQIVSWGMGYWLTIWMARTFESGWVLTLEWAHALAVAPLAALGLLLALIGLVTGPRRRDPAEPSPPAGGPTSAS